MQELRTIWLYKVHNPASSGATNSVHFELLRTSKCFSLILLHLWDFRSISDGGKTFCSGVQLKWWACSSSNTRDVLLWFTASLTDRAPPLSSADILLWTVTGGSAWEGPGTAWLIDPRRMPVASTKWEAAGVAGSGELVVSKLVDAAIEATARHPFGEMCRSPQVTAVRISSFLFLL